MATADKTTPQPANCAAAQRRAGTVLAVLALGNAAFIAVLALQHPVLAKPTQSVMTDALYMANFVFAQALVLLVPAWLLGKLLVRRSAASGALAGGSVMALVVAVFYLDAAVHHVTGLRLFEPATWELARPIIGRVGEFTAQTSFWAFARPVALFLAVEGLFAFLGVHVARRWQSCAEPRLLLVPAASWLGVTAPLAFIAGNPAASLDRYLSTELVSNQPLFMTRLFDRRPTVGDARLAARWQTRLLLLEPELAAAEMRYRTLTPVRGPARRPDVIAIVVESLRADAVNEQSAPNLAAFSQKSIVATRHFSTGNSTQLGYFGLLYGLDALWYRHAVETGIPPGMTRLLRQVGYHTAFVGSWSLDWKGMGLFLNEQTFDTFSMLPLPKAYFDGDKRVVAVARQILERQGPFQALADTPVFLVVQINTTHWEYHSEPVDQIFVPTAGSDQLLWSDADAPLVHNRFRNSVHCMDRLIAPLLEERAIVLVAGDHGQSFGEDGRFFHGTAPSDVQAQTTFILHVPGAAPRTLEFASAHRDFLPTVLDALGIALNHPRQLSGNSLLPAKGDPQVPLFVGENDGRFGVLRRLDAGQPAAIGHGISLDCWDAWCGFSGPVNELAQPSKKLALTDDELGAAIERILEANLGLPVAAPPADPLPSLLDVLRQGADTARELRALRILDQMGVAARPAAATIRTFLDDDRPAIRAVAFELAKKLASE